MMIQSSTSGDIHGLQICEINVSKKIQEQIMYSEDRGQPKQTKYCLELELKMSRGSEDNGKCKTYSSYL